METFIIWSGGIILGLICLVNLIGYILLFSGLQFDRFHLEKTVYEERRPEGDVLIEGWGSERVRAYTEIRRCVFCGREREVKPLDLPSMLSY